jgi:two-component system alkaline phosphatase synthesis response regulator PhoP
MAEILIIEDEESILMALEDDLTLEGYTVTTATDGQTGFSAASQKRFDLLILDIMLPAMNGFDVCKKLRENGVTTPIIMLTARGQEIDRVLGLELGADDYVTKPFSPRELLARIKAILRRVNQTRQAEDLVSFGNLEVDFKKYEVRKKGKQVYLTSLEFALLKFLVDNSDRVLSRNDILDGVWGGDVHVFDRTVDTHIGHLRKKIEENPDKPRHILSIRGVGYRFGRQ